MICFRYIFIDYHHVIFILLLHLLRFTVNIMFNMYHKNNFCLITNIFQFTILRKEGIKTIKTIVINNRIVLI